MLASTVQNCEGINICWFKPPGLWYSVKVALGNSYNKYSTRLHLTEVTVLQGLAKYDQ